MNTSIYIKYLNLGLVNKLNHHGFIIRMLNKWFDKNRRVMNIPNGKLIENEDFQLLFIFNGSSEEACISCSCGVKVQLTKLRQNFQLGNYYKHLKSKSCIMMKKKMTSPRGKRHTSVRPKYEEVPRSIETFTER